MLFVSSRKEPRLNKVVEGRSQNRTPMNRWPTERRVNPVEFWRRLARDSNYDAKIIASTCGVTLRQLERLFHHDLCRTPKNWLNEQRMAHARRLLLECESVKEVAFRLNFRGASHFCHLFKQCYKVTPSEFVARNDKRHNNVAFTQPMSRLSNSIELFRPR